MVRELVEACLALNRELDSLPADCAARARAATLDPDESPEAVAREALGPGAEPAEVSQLAALLASIAELAPPAIRELARAGGGLRELDAIGLRAIAPFVARLARQARGQDRRSAAVLVSSLARAVPDEDLAPLLRRALRALCLQGPAEVSRAALPGLLALGASLAADDELLARLDLLLALGGAAEAGAALGAHLAADADAFDLLVAKGSRGAAPDRWRAAELLGCLAAVEQLPERPRHDPVALCTRLLADDSVRVWRAAASALGRLAGRLPAASEAIEAFLSTKAPIHLQRHAAAALGALYPSAPLSVEQAVDRILRRGADPWNVASLALSLVDLARGELALFARLLERLLAGTPGPPVVLNLTLVLRDLALAGAREALELARPRVGQAVAGWLARDPGGAALRWAAADALSIAGQEPTTPALGSSTLIAARLALEEQRGVELAHQIERCIDLGWAQLRRVDEVDTAVGLEGQGRALFEIRDLVEALFEGDLLLPALRQLSASHRTLAPAQAADHERLRAQARARLLGCAPALESRDRFRRAELCRGIVRAVDGRFSVAGALEARLRDRDARARQLGGIAALVPVAGRPEKPIVRIAAAALARLLDAAAGESPASALEALLSLLPGVDGTVLEEVACSVDSALRPLVAAAGRAARAWREEPDLRGRVTVEELRRLSEPAPEGRLRSALLEAASAIEQLAGIDSAGAIAAPTAGAAATPMVLLARSAREIALAVTAGVDGVRCELFGSESRSDEAERARRRLEKSRCAAHELGARLEQLAAQLSDAARRLGADARPGTRRGLVDELRQASEAMVVALQSGLALPIGTAVEQALEGWRAALDAEAEAVAAAQVVASIPKTVVVQTGVPRHPDEVVAGSRIGDYEVVEVISAGGMGRVWKARQVSLDRFVAIKLMLPHVAADPTNLERFRREARIMGRWCHDSLHRVIDFHDDGPFPYLVTEFVEGGSLHALAAREAISPARAVEIGAQTARALAHAHREAVIHRDVSPENILVRKDGRALLTDFGVALLVEATHLTEHGGVPGKHRYISPEQAKGEAYDGKADVYALGVVLFELLARKPPFDGPQATVLTGKVTRDAPSLARLCPDHPRPLCELIQRMLLREPRERPTAEEAAVELERLAGELERSPLVTLVSEAPRMQEQTLCVACLVLRHAESIKDIAARQRTIAWWYRAARAVIEKSGGLSDRHLSGRVYGFFGVPAPRPDDAARAVAAVRRAERAVRGLAESSGAALELRAGLARGTALVGEDRGSSPPLCVFGPVVERAEALAGSDLDESGLRADEAIHAATADRSLYLKRCAVDRGCGRIFFIEARGG